MNYLWIYEEIEEDKPRVFIIVASTIEGSKNFIEQFEIKNEIAISLNSKFQLVKNLPFAEDSERGIIYTNYYI